MWNIPLITPLPQDLGYFSGGNLTGNTGAPALIDASFCPVYDANLVAKTRIKQMALILYTHEMEAHSFRIGVVSETIFTEMHLRWWAIENSWEIPDNGFILSTALNIFMVKVYPEEF